MNVTPTVIWINIHLTVFMCYKNLFIIVISKVKFFFLQRQG